MIQRKPKWRKLSGLGELTYPCNHRDSSLAPGSVETQAENNPSSPDTGTPSTDYLHPKRELRFRTDNSFDDIQIIDKSDPRFSELTNKARDRRQRTPSGDPEKLAQGQAAVRRGQLVETIVNNMIGEMVPVRPSCGLIYNCTSQGGLRRSNCILEIDGLITSAGNPDICLETKLSLNLRPDLARWKGFRQLEIRCDILGRIWPAIRGLLVVVSNHDPNARSYPILSLNDMQQSSQYFRSILTSIFENNSLALLSLPYEAIIRYAQNNHNLYSKEQHELLARAVSSDQQVF